MGGVTAYRARLAGDYIVAGSGRNVVVADVNTGRCIEAVAWSQ